MPLVLISVSTVEPVTLAEVRLHLKIDTTAEDELLKSYISVARNQAENIMQRQIMPATYKLVMKAFPCDTGVIILPKPPLSTISTNVSVSYYRDSTIVNDSTSVSATVYTVDYESEPGMVYPIYDNEWPSCVTDEKKDAVQITYICGYSSIGLIPEAIKLWIKMRVGSMYEYREPIFEGRFIGQMQPLGYSYYDGLLDPYIISTGLFQ